jgi:hypothetical protein
MIYLSNLTLIEIAHSVAESAECDSVSVLRELERHLLRVTPGEERPPEPSAPQQYKHKPNCLWATPLPTGAGYWGCDCGLDKLLLDLEEYEAAAGTQPTPCDFCENKRCSHPLMWHKGRLVHHATGKSGYYPCTKFPGAAQGDRLKQIGTLK